jgi:hypothetical protein
MRSIQTIGLVIIFCGLLTSAFDKALAGEPASQPDKPDPDVVQWRAHCDLDDGRRFFTDGSLLLESRYVSGAAVPEKSVPPQAAQRLLQTSTDHEFGLKDLNRKAAGGHYIAPGSIQLNRKYIDYLRGSPLKATLRFRAKGADDPVLILDDQKVVGVMMPMKS